MTGAIVVIGNEILTGQIQDKNVVFIAKRLFQMGITLQQVAVVADNPQDIAAQINYGIVFTVGGLGCTLDDVTMAGVALAFDDSLVFSKILFDILSRVEKNVDLSSTDCINALTKMATLPSKAILNHRFARSTDHYPVVSLDNVFILPGPPSAVQDQFIIIEKLIHTKNRDTFFQASTWIISDEKVISTYLDDISVAYPDASIGSYPNDKNLEIVFTSKVNVVEAMMAELMTKLPADIVISCSQDNLLDSGSNADVSLHRLNRLPIPTELFDDSEFGMKLSRSISVIRGAIEKYGADHIAMSFNGGKDCTVLLHLLVATLDLIHSESNITNCTVSERKAPIKSLYIMAHDPFVEVEEFVDECIIRYNLDLERITKPMKEGLKDYLDAKPQVEAIFIGTRRTDPYSNHLADFNMTDDGWPEIMRIHPVLDWDYVDVWKFLRRSNIRYCMLYDQGYTSIGGTTNTDKNPKLKDIGWISGYRPAYRLLDVTKERDGRISK